LAKIGPVDVEIIDMTKSLKINKKQRQNVSPPSAVAAAASQKSGDTDSRP